MLSKSPIKYCNVKKKIEFQICMNMKTAVIESIAINISMANKKKVMCIGFTEMLVHSQYMFNVIKHHCTHKKCVLLAGHEVNTTAAAINSKHRKFPIIITGKKASQK